jgi:hypothetical protein
VHRLVASKLDGKLVELPDGGGGGAGGGAKQRCVECGGGGAGAGDKEEFHDTMLQVCCVDDPWILNPKP